MAKKTNNKYKITARDIFGGIIFSIALIGIGYLLNNKGYGASATGGPSPIVEFIFGHISNPYVLFGLFIFIIILYPIISAMCGAIATSNVFGLHRQSFFEKIWPTKGTKKKTDNYLK